MKKQLDTTAMENELKGGSAFFRQPTSNSARSEEKESPTLPASSTQPEIDAKEPEPSVPAGPVNHPTDQSTNQSTKQSTHQLTGRVVSRPVGFYIPEAINKKIDDAVQYYLEKHRMKFDRSAVVSAILGDPNVWTDEALDRLAGRVTDQLTNRLTSRLSD